MDYFPKKNFIDISLKLNKNIYELIYYTVKSLYNDNIKPTV